MSSSSSDMLSQWGASIHLSIYLSNPSIYPSIYVINLLFAHVQVWCLLVVWLIIPYYCSSWNTKQVALPLLHYYYYCLRCYSSTAFCWDERGSQDCSRCRSLLHSSQVMLSSSQVWGEGQLVPGAVPSCPAAAGRHAGPVTHGENILQVQETRRQTSNLFHSHLSWAVWIGGRW